VSVRIDDQLYDDLLEMFPQWGELSNLMRAILKRLVEERRQSVDELFT
jgi:hypothetical protein